jgi:hypothetical protein
VPEILFLDSNNTVDYIYHENIDDAPQINLVLEALYSDAG